jgi:hypothetical protein
MFDVLNFDLSWTRRPLTGEDLLKLIDGAATVTDLKDALSKKLTKMRVWDIIANNVLDQPVSWSAIQEELSKIKDFRNKAAHFQIITESEKTELIKMSRSITGKLSKQKTLDYGQLSVLQNAAEIAANTFRAVNWQAIEDMQKAQGAWAAQALEALQTAIKPTAFEAIQASLKPIVMDDAFLKQVKASQVVYSAIPGITGSSSKAKKD